MPQIVSYVDPEEIKLLRQIADSQRVTVAEVVRRALNVYTSGTVKADKLQGRPTGDPK